MIPTPNPLHPAVVHFPVVLLLLGAVAACAAVVVRRWHLPQVAAVLLGLGAAGAVVAMETGEEEEERVTETPAVEQVLEQHEDWAGRTRTAAVVAAVLAVASACLGRVPAMARATAGLAAAAALGAGWCVAQTGHYGGELVYRHGAGIQAPAGNPSGATPARKRDDD